MYCSECGSKLEPSSGFCGNCGHAVAQSNINENVIQQSTQNYNTATPEENVNNTEKNKGLASLICGIVSIPLSITCLPPLILGVIAIFLGAKTKPKTGKSKAGIALGITGVSLSLIFTLLSSLLLIGIGGTETLYGNGYELEYTSIWKVDESSNNPEELVHSLFGSIFAPFDKQTLSQSDIDFSTTEGKKRVYDTYHIALDIMSETSLVSLTGGSEEFSILKDDIYYATIDFTFPGGKAHGRLHILVSEEKDMVLSFYSKSLPSYNKFTNDAVLKMLKTISIAG